MDPNDGAGWTKKTIFGFSNEFCSGSVKFLVNRIPMWPSQFNLDFPPLVLVLAKVQFPTILKIGTLIPDLQEFVRTAGFPTYRQKQVRQIKFGAQAPEQVEQHYWQFLNEENTELLSVGQDFLTLTVSNYKTFKAFSGSMIRALEGVANVVKPSAMTGIGFRCLNVIEPPDESPESLWRLVSPRLHGIDPDGVGASHFHHEYQYWCETPQGNLIIQTKYLHGKDAIPPDLRNEQLQLKRTFDSKQCVLGLQLDHNTFRKQKSSSFEPGAILGDLEQIHETANRGFLGCITEEALKLWGFHPLS